jgi:Protein of unknown function (DUF2927)
MITPRFVAPCRWRKARVLPALGAIAILLAACQSTPTSGELTDDNYVADFEIVAFYREFDPEKKEHELTRWETPLKVALVGDVSDRYTGYAIDQLKDMSEMSGLPVDLAGADEANVVVIFSPEPFDAALTTYRDVYRPFFVSEASMDRLTDQMKKEATCYGRIITADDNSNQIVGAVILIPTDQGRFIVRACIIEELTQAMGLFNDSDDVQPSIFNDSSPNMTLTDHDRILFRLLYDDRLKTGMTWQEAEPIVRQILPQIRSQQG